MKEQKYSIVWSTQFKKDYKRSMKRHLDIALLDDIIRIPLFYCYTKKRAATPKRSYPPYS